MTVALCRGKNARDKRVAIKNRDQKRDMDREAKRFKDTRG